MVKLQEGKSQFWITVPKDLIKKKKWVKGKELVWSFNERGNLELMPVEE